MDLVLGVNCLGMMLRKSVGSELSVGRVFFSQRSRYAASMKSLRDVVFSIELKLGTKQIC